MIGVAARSGGDDFAQLAASVQAMRELVCAAGETAQSEAVTTLHSLARILERVAQQ
ncbi:hypothetical protein GXW78_25690 [Roseomonas terrae]|uniref:Uncharacterized protein n=1 Tax=Neoroseomonas terrae TaxID=424799 RepID=A0ABS5EPV9_9PROT|nr:hypothetical protein [Neoroseomonas terrae]MBR0653074.1 hypothetical protein [Neoroseomonas terrae]